METIKLMGTTSSDTLYHGLAHAATPPPKQQRYIDLRWKEWEPWLVMQARRESLDPANLLYRFRTLHRERVIRLLSVHISWDAIRKHRLDDPTWGKNLFEFALAAAMERRRTRMGRVKGISRGRGI